MKAPVVIGIGNEYRRDDGIGPAVAEEVAKRGVPGIRVVTATGEPGAILEAWSGARLAVVIDAAAGEGSCPGRIRRWTPGETADLGLVSSHAIGLPQAYALGQAVAPQPRPARGALRRRRLNIGIVGLESTTARIGLPTWRIDDAATRHPP